MSDDGWQPLVTAPKDGQGVLLYDAEYPGEIMAASWTMGRWALWGLSSMAYPDDFAPTHWQAFPQPPEAL